jgi:NADH:ubiquinone oxidoreductase subunit E
MNFALILFVLVILTGVAWVADKLVFMPQRRRAADAVVAEFDRQQARVGETRHKRAPVCVTTSCVSRGGSSIRRAFSR